MSRSDKKNGYRVMRVYLVCNLLVVLVVTMSIAGGWVLILMMLAIVLAFIAGRMREG